MMKFALVSRVALTAILLVAGNVCVADEKSEAKEDSLLTIGSVAPALDIEHWVSDGNGKFQPVTEFEKGKVYVVEFWATVCIPCIFNMPDLVELQNSHAEDGVQIIGVSSEDMKTVDTFLERKYRAFGKAARRKGQPATFRELTSAYCLATDPDCGTHADYLAAAGQNSIPCCFVVGKTGHVEWIGGPVGLEKVLKAVIADKWDRDAATKEYAVRQKVDVAVEQARTLKQDGDFAGALALFEAIREEVSGDFAATIDFHISRVNEAKMEAMVGEGKIDEVIAMIDESLASAEEADKTELKAQKLSMLLLAGEEKEAAVVLEGLISTLSAVDLNHIAWATYESAAEEGSEVATELVEAATAAAKKAARMKSRNAVILDTLAHLIHLSGDLDEAIVIQKKAVKLQRPPSAPISEFLEQLEKEAAEKDGSKDNDQK